jgi:hypothetical protein
LHSVHQISYGALVWVHQTSWNLDADFGDRRAPLLLENNARLIVGLCGISENGRNAYTIDICAFGPSETLSGLPCALNTVRVGVRDPTAVRNWVFIIRGEMP